MPLDFRLLSMTELRNRPGEIFDRVADEGEAFIIEKGGRRKACLVPLSVFFPDVSPSRIAAEMEELNKHGEQTRVEITKAKELALRFEYGLADGSSVELKIVLPHGYPSTCPRVYANPVNESTPHRWSDGALCLYGVMSGWNPGRHTTLSTLNLARQWLQRYDIWKESGQWPKVEG
jgi:prevent-host-death family protein